MVHQTLQAKRSQSQTFQDSFYFYSYCTFTWNPSLNGNGNVPQLTCVSIAGFVSHSARTCSFSSSPAVPATKQIWLAGWWRHLWGIIHEFICKKTKKTSHQGQLQANAKIMMVVKKQVTHSVTSQSMKALKTLVLTEVKEARVRWCCVSGGWRKPASIWTIRTQ